MSEQTIINALKKGYKPHFLIECDFNGYKDRIAQQNVSFSDRLFKGLLLNDISYGMTFSFDRFQYNVGSIKVKRNNADRFQDQETRRRLDGGVCSIYVWCESLSWSDISTGGLLFKGLFQKDYHNENEYVFNVIGFSKQNKKSLVPKVTINDDTWPLHRKAGGGGSVSGSPVPLVFGDFPGGVLAQCVDYSTDFLYVVMHGISKSSDSDFTAGTENVYDNDGYVINAGNYTLTKGIDSLGNPATYINFTGNYASEEPITCSIQGMEDGSGEYTGTAGTLIEHPADIMAYLSDNYGESGTHTDTETLKTLKIAFPGLKYAMAIYEQQDIDDFFRNLFSQIQCAILPRIGGGHGVMVFNPDRGASGSIIKSHSQIGKDKFTKTPERLLCNNLEVQYGKNYATGQYESTIKRTKENNTDCKQSYLQYDYEYEKTIYLDGVHDDNAAALIANRFVDIFAFRHDILEWNIPWQDGYGYQEGDAIEITHPDGPSSDGNGWSYERCILIEKKYTSKHISQQLWRADV